MFDYAIVNGRIVDGTGKAPFIGSICVQGEKVAAVLEGNEIPHASKIIDATGLTVAPGFVDLHTHSDTSPYCAPGFESALTQGITFQLAGNCGGSLVPHRLAEHDARARRMSGQKFANVLKGEDYNAYDVKTYAEELSSRGLAINFGTLVGHGTLRTFIMQNPTDPVPTQEELQEMAATLDAQLLQGAFGMSVGLTYSPGSSASTEELIELAKVLKKREAVFAIHMRNEGEGVFDALAEMRRVASETGVHIHIAHLKLMFMKQWGRAKELLAEVDRMRQDGLHITCDQYPYCASSTGFTALLPGWVKSGTADVVLSRLLDDDVFERMRPEIREELERRGGASFVTVAFTSGAMPEFDGQTLAYIADALNVTPEDAYRQVLIASKCASSGIYHAMREDDVETIARRTDIAVGSDGFGYDNCSTGTVGKPHPRSTGAFARFLRLARDKQLMPIEAAIHKVSGLPASFINLKDRGLIKEGAYADLVVFDEKIIRDNATFENPTAAATGVHTVFVNGQIAYNLGVFSSKLHGHFLRSEY